MGDMAIVPSGAEELAQLARKITEETKMVRILAAGSLLTAQLTSRYDSLP